VWWGQIKAIYAIVLVGTFFLGAWWDKQHPAGLFVIALILVVLVHIVLSILNTFAKAFTGRPLIYDAIEVDKRR
jgi:formate hydrogenlyase subunit 4